FNDKIAKMMSPTGVYMINIIDVYESDETARENAEKTISNRKQALAFKKAEAKIATQKITETSEKDRIHKEELDRTTLDPAEEKSVRDDALERARGYGGFLGAWARTAKLTFPYIYIFGTDRNPGAGKRETFVVVASRQPLDLKDLALHDDDPQFY